MDGEHALTRALKHLADDVRLFIDLSLKESDASWDEWLRAVSRDAQVKCWERKDCRNVECPAHSNTSSRCWLIAGTMCGGVVRGDFALKYKSCTECDVYRESVFIDPATEIYEHVLTLVHSLRLTQDRLKTLATRDALTGLYNRNFFNEILLNEIERTRRYGASFSIVLLDVDGFKWVNDTYGHLFGDRLLRDCAAILERSVRASDILVRYGGDEFLIIVTGGGHEECGEIMGRIRRGVEDWNTEQADPEFSLSISAGCSRYEPGGEIMEVLKEADERMYLDKRSG